MTVDKICFFIFSNDKMWIVSVFLFSLIAFIFLYIFSISYKYRIITYSIVVLLGICAVILFFIITNYLKMDDFSSSRERNWEMIRPFYPGLIVAAIILSVDSKIHSIRGNKKRNIEEDQRKDNINI